MKKTNFSPVSLSPSLWTFVRQNLNHLVKGLIMVLVGLFSFPGSNSGGGRTSLCCAVLSHTRPALFSGPPSSPGLHGRETRASLWEHGSLPPVGDGTAGGCARGGGASAGGGSPHHWRVRGPANTAVQTEGGSPWQLVCGGNTYVWKCPQFIIRYRIAENFRGRKLSRIGKNTIFAEKPFADWLLLQRQRMPRPKFRRENFRI